ncbi:heme o synthase [Flavobacteriaceae bacterium]|nr:protoheme IX farnesyltransferase [Flavobacteriales bacterium]MBL6877398.1 protoheme IX farnesyltransferase [Flavobacteriaceae bacterium]MDA9550480.1 heme o synthase [Flavobacteriaceae bacterium]MDA9849724.1 heme o synthase [Flavobacteriaceae bacterium]MDB2599360.1 heme o synthase [Flavobacteriaceae bacterium]
MQDNKFTFSSFIEITKLRLSVSVVFSSVISYLIGMSEFDFEIFSYLVVGGLMMVSASNIFNQVIERDLDALMQRTKGRPLPMGQISVNNALILGFTFVIAGLTFLYIISPLCAMLGAISIFIYACVYTPLKLITPLSVFVGAIPGAIPFMLGWVAATNELGVEALALFLMQFFWQFPHFWAIAWWQNDEYEKAGFKMLPTGRKDKSTTFQIIFYSFWAIIMSIVPYFNVTGDLSLSTYGLVIVLMLGMFLLFYSFQLFKTSTTQNAKVLMYVSILYLTLVQIVYLIDNLF